jgi:hypothetical protein
MVAAVLKCDANGYASSFILRVEGGSASNYLQPPSGRPLKTEGLQIVLEAV